MIKISFLSLLIISFFFTMILSISLLRFLQRVKVTAENFQGKTIPQAAGLIFVGGFLLASLYSQIAIGQLSVELLYLVIGIIGITLLGLIDDLFGDKKVKGLKGHLKELFKGKITTGSLKAVGGSLLALFLVIPFSQYQWEVILNTLIVALSINLTNLLDLRPGRAIKGFLFILLMISLVGDRLGIFWVGLIIGAVLAYLPYDLKAQAMMGDTGSNPLGLTVGFAMIWGLPLTGKIIGLSILILIHLYAEYKSISKLIELSPVLSLLDRIGR